MYHIAVVGATGVVGRKMLALLEEYRFPIQSLRLFASHRSQGQKYSMGDQEYTIETLTENSFDSPIDIAFFSAGGEISKKYAPLARSKGTIVIDNSSAWRMDDEIALVVPEINGALLTSGVPQIIANPNCSTIQSVLPLKPLHDAFGLKRVLYTTYQAVSGSGQKGIDDLKRGSTGEAPQCYAHPIYSNCLPHIDLFLEDGYTKEEQKMIDETRKILALPNLPVSATCVRVPVWNGHSVAINATFEKPASVQEIHSLLANFPGIRLEDAPQENRYPMPILADGGDEVWVGRIREDRSLLNTFHLWCSADNIRKGAASNAIQIALQLIQKNV